MCGIVGIASNKNCIKHIVSGLKSLEYRGYDSSGIAFIENNNIKFKKNVGKIFGLEKKIIEKKIKGNSIIGHTRWATHGKPSLKNCHPFVKDNCALVHNGIIENYEEIVKKFSLKNQNIKSETDSEIASELFNKILNDFNDPIKAIERVNKLLEGTFSFALLIKGTKSIYATKKGSPLVVGVSEESNSISSDVLALPDSTNEVIFLEENDIVEINENECLIYNKNTERIKREKHKYISNNDFNTKGPFKHFMQKEIFHQPSSIQDTLLNFYDKKSNSIFLPKCEIDFNKISQLILTACGTAYHSCMIAKYWFEQFAEITTQIDIGSEYRYRNDKINKNSVGIVVSQSGETMDTLECLKKFKLNSIFSISLVNVLNSSIARSGDYILPTIAGPEIGVASTKAFTSQLIVFALLNLYIKKQKKLQFTINDKKIFDSLFNLKRNLSQTLLESDFYKKIAFLLKDAKSIFYIGRGTMYPLALEGALKLKEITYKHCEGYAAGELKHGPLALIEKNIPVIALAPFDNNFPKILSNIQEIKARGGKVIILTDKEGYNKSKKYCDETILLPKSNVLTAPIIYSIPVQLIAYHLAVILGTDVDQPRNLAKSVTVE